MTPEFIVESFFIEAGNAMAVTSRLRQFGESEIEVILSFFSSEENNYFDLKPVEIRVRRSQIDFILNCEIHLVKSSITLKYEIPKEQVFVHLYNNELLNENLFHELSAALFNMESEYDSILIRKEWEVTDSGHEFNSILTSLEQLKKIDDYLENYWELQFHFCFERIQHWIRVEDFKSSLTLLEHLLELRPNFFDAYPLITECFHYLDMPVERDKKYSEILEWALGDWNALMDAIDEKNGDQIYYYYETFLNKVNFFIENVEEFFYAYKMRAQLFSLTNDEDSEKRDMDQFNYFTSLYGKGFQPKWASRYVLN